MSVSESDCVESSDVLRTFIATYEELALLWNPSDSNYKNKDKRNAALVKLVSIYEKCKPGATVFDVRRKINTLGCNYRKELKKIEDSIRSGARDDDVYIPSSWVFHALQFINNFEQPVGLENLQVQLDEDKEEEKNENLSRTEEIPLYQSSITSRSSIVPDLERKPKKARGIGPIARQNELLHKACAYLDKSLKKHNEPEIPTIAKAWGEKLLQLHPQQRALAEKYISDILFEASQGTLQRNSVKINEGFSYNSSKVALPVESVDTRVNGLSPNSKDPFPQN